MMKLGGNFFAVSVISSCRALEKSGTDLAGLCCQNSLTVSFHSWCWLGRPSGLQLWTEQRFRDVLGQISCKPMALVLKEMLLKVSCST